MIEFEQRPDDASALVATGLRERWEVTESGEGRRTFSVPESLGPGKLQRLVDAGHTPVDPDALPSAVTYPPEESESGSESASGDQTPEDTSEEQPASESESEPPEPLDEMDRSELYSLGNEEYGMEWDWSGEEAPSAEEMREQLREAT